MISQPLTRVRENQLSNDALAIGTETLLFLSENEDELEGTVIESRFFESVRLFYETAVMKMLAKFPHKDKTLKDLSFLDPRNRTKCSPQALVHLCKHFMTDDSDEIDAVVEYRGFSVAPDCQLPHYHPTGEDAIDYFWSAMAELKIPSVNKY